MISRELDHSRRPGHPWHGAGAFLAAGLVGGMLMLWAWNTVAVDLFALPEARFRHVLAFEAGLLGLLWIAAGAAGVLGFRRPHRG